MFYHIYLAYRENNETKFIYKTTTTDTTSVYLEDIPKNVLYIPVMYASEDKTAVSVENVLKQKNLITANAIINLPVPKISYTSTDKENHIRLKSNLVDTVYNYGYTEECDREIIKDILNGNILDRSKENVYITGKASRHIKTNFPEFGININTMFYGQSSEPLVLPLNKELEDNTYTLKQITLNKWLVNNKTEFPLSLYDDKNVLFGTIDMLGMGAVPEGNYKLVLYKGITKYTGTLNLTSKILDLSDFRVMSIEFNKIDNTKALVTWSAVSSADEYDVIYDNEVIHTTDKCEYEFPLNSNAFYSIDIRAKNKFSVTKPSVSTFYKLDKPTIPTVTINGVDDVVMYLPKQPVDSLKCYVYGVEHPTGKYVFLGCTDNYEFSFELKHVEMFDEFVYRYGLNNSYSEYSDILEFVHPTIFNRRLLVEYLSVIEKDYLDCLFRWRLDPLAQKYSIYKNGLFIADIDLNSGFFRLPAYVGDVVCLHSYYGLKESESNIVIVGNDVEDIPVSNEINLKIESSIDKTITVNWFIYEDVFDVDIYVFDIQDNMIHKKDNAQGTSASFIVPNYGKYKVTAKVRRTDKPDEETDFARYVDVVTAKAQKPNIIEDTNNNRLMLKLYEVNNIVNPTYTVKIVEPTTDKLLVYHYTDIKDGLVPLEYTGHKHIKISYNIHGKHEDGYYLETGFSDAVVYYNTNDIVFTATVEQMSNLPNTYGNVIQIDIDDSMSPSKPLYFDIVIEKENGDILKFTIPNSRANNSFMFGNLFETSFGLDMILPLIVDLKEMVGATITITGHRFNHSYTVVLHYNVMPLPKPVKVLEMLVDCKPDLYTYDFKWEREPDTMYKLTDLTTNIDYEIYDSTAHLELPTFSNSFSLFSYNISGRTEAVFMEVPIMTETYGIQVVNGNKEVRMSFSPVSYATEYKLYIDNREYMNVTTTDFLLKPFAGEKEITVRACYSRDIYTVLGYPSSYLYTPKTIDNNYILDYSLINDNKFIRLQIQNEIIEENVKWVNFYVLGESNETIFKKVLEKPIDDLKYVYEIPNLNSINIMYAELVNGWSVQRTNIIDLATGIFIFDYPKGNFDSNFV